MTVQKLPRIIGAIYQVTRGNAARAVRRMKKTRETALMKKKAVSNIMKTITCARTTETNARKPVKCASNYARDSKSLNNWMMEILLKMIMEICKFK